MVHVKYIPASPSTVKITEGFEASHHSHKTALDVDGKGTPALTSCPDVAARSDAFHDKVWHL